jgi:cytosine/adenosine deaminase-related metal-dependent hydrolase
LADSFEDEYAVGVLEEEPPAPADTATLRGALEAQPRTAAPEEAFALRGCVLTPARRINDACVVIDGATIAAVSAQPPEGVQVIDTDGVIVPGMVDLHGHPEYNVFAAWEPPKLYTNRHQWRRSKEYAKVVKEPWAELKQIREKLVRYAEARSLVGGVTAIQGASRNYVKKEEALVRNVDLRIFGRHNARSIVDLDRTDEADRARIREQIAAREVTALYVHLAEGVDDSSRTEFDDLVGAGLLTAATVIIHGTALDDEQLSAVHDAGAKLVWSPQSNLRLYGATTNVRRALELGVPVALGADWLPSGSQSLLAEMRVARRQLAAQGHPIEAIDLVRMVTRDAAQIAGVGDLLGRLEAGRAADVVVFERSHPDPWESIARSDPSDVELVVLGGNLAYGRSDWIQLLTPSGEAEAAVAWGKPVALDTTYSVAAAPSAPPRLADLRAALLGIYPQTGPIFG